MRIIAVLLTIIFYSVEAVSCLVELYPNYIKVSRASVSKASEVIKKSECEHKIVKQVASLVTRLEGTVTSHHIKRILKDNGSLNVVPERIVIRTAEDILREHYSLKSKWSFEGAKFNRGEKVLAYNEGDNIEVTCNACDRLGRASFSIRAMDILSGKKREVWGNTTIVLQTRALVASKTLSPNKPLEISDINDVVMNHTQPGELFRDKAKLTFYKPNKAIVSGTPIKRSDLSPIYLVRTNRPVNIVLESGLIGLRGKALPLKSAKIGEIIQLKNFKSSKVIVGKVIGVNKVQVEL